MTTGAVIFIIIYAICLIALGFAIVAFLIACDDAKDALIDLRDELDRVNKKKN